MLKDELRLLVKERRRQYSRQQLETLSQTVVKRLAPHLRDASVVMAFYSLPDEVDTHQLIDDLVAMGKTVLLPKVLDDGGMELRRYTSAADLQEGAFHIMEAVGDSFTDYNQIDVALIPGVAFDAQGHRLGRGTGYYDRFLRALGTVPLHTIGVCFEFQKVENVPIERHDVSVDIVI